MQIAVRFHERRSLTGVLLLTGILTALLLALQLPVQAAYSGTAESYSERIVYGYSGEGRELVAYRYGTGDNVMVLGFEIHGYEDHFARDGSCLVYTAYQLIDYLQTSELVRDHGWTVYVLPKMNPDGLESGTSCDGPGRCTTTCLDADGNVSSAHGIDINRSFPTDFTVSYSLRNYTGPEPLRCRESVALYNFVQSVQGSGINILFDVHGWEQSTIVFDGKYGTINSIVSQYFKNNAYESGHAVTEGGYLTTWAHAIGYTTCLLEMPAIYDSYADYVNSDCTQNMISVVKELLQIQHTYQEASAQEATCTTAGSRTYVCSGCGHTTTETIPAKGHQWALTEITDAPTATADGAGSYRCSVCGATKQDTVSRIFTDTSSDSYYAEAVDWGYGAGIVSGWTEHAFRPHESLTRGMLVTMLYRMNGSPETAYQPVFADVPDGAYYTSAVIWAYQNGIVTGISETTFGPKLAITREQLAAMLYRYAAWTGLNPDERADLSGFSDTDQLHAYAETAMEWCVANGIVNGKGPALLAPRAYADRAQGTAMLYRLKIYLENHAANAAEENTDTDEAGAVASENEPEQGA